MNRLFLFIYKKINDNSYIFIDRLPNILTYGKHFFTLAWRAPVDSPYQLKRGSNINLNSNLSLKLKEVIEKKHSASSDSKLIVSYVFDLVYVAKENISKLKPLKYKEYYVYNKGDLKNNTGWLKGIKISVDEICEANSGLLD